MIVRPFEPADAEAVVRLRNELPEADQNFLKAPSYDEGAAQHQPVRRSGKFVACEDDGRILGEVAVLGGVGWSSHVGELELIVAPEHRGRGVGTALAERALIEAVQLGLTHVFVEVAAEQTGLIAMFQRLGFEPEALLRDFILDRRGDSHDLIVLTHRVEQTWSELLTLGVDEELDAG